MIKDTAKMAVVRCLILCSKFTKNRLSAGLCLDPLGELTALPRSLAESWGKGEERGMEGKEAGKGNERER